MTIPMPPVTNELLRKIRELYTKMHNAVETQEAIYFVSGGYANDSHRLSLLIKELDEFLCNNSIELAPSEWIRLKENERF